MEKEWADEAVLENREYSPILDTPFQWQSWAAPKDADGKLDDNAAMTGEDLIDFVNGKLFPYLKKFKESTDDADSLDYKIGEIFSEIVNKFRSGYSLRDALEIIGQLNFGSQEAKHELSDLYETRIKRMGNAGRNGGEYYTPRPLIRAMIKVVQPQISETIYDGACGSAGFLCEAWNHLRLDVLAYVRFTLAPLSRRQRAGTAKTTGLDGYQREMRSFLEYVLEAYERHGVDELASRKIADFLRIRYGGTNDAKRVLGTVPAIRDAFIAIQAHLYQ